MNRTVERTTAVLIYFFGSLLILLLAAAIFTQLPVFRRIIIGQLVKTVEQSTNGTLQVRSIEGDLINGFILNGVDLRLKTHTLYDSVPILHSDQVLVRYSLIRFLRGNQIGATSIVLNNPTIKILKFAGDTNWNINLLFKPRLPNAPPKKPFTSIVDLQSLRIQNGTMLVRDFNNPVQPMLAVQAAENKAPPINWSDLRIDGLDLDCRLYANGSKAQSVRVNHLRLNERESGFFLQHLAFSAYLDTIQARIDDAQIVTGYSDLEIALEVAPPSVLHSGGIHAMEHASTILHLNGPSISSRELKQFIPSLDFMSNTPGIDLMTDGEFGHLHVKKLNLDFKRRGSIDISGYVNNLHNTHFFNLDLNIVGKNLTQATVATFVPGLHIPDLSRYGTINIPTLTFVGPPLNFKTALDIRSGAGNLAGKVALDVRNRGFLYNADLRSEHLNLYAFVPKPAMQTNLNLAISMHGSGTHWRTMNSTIAVKSTAPTVFGAYAFDQLDLAAVFNSGVGTIDHLIGSLAGGPNVNIHNSMVDLRSPQIAYHINGLVQDFPLSKFISSIPKSPARLQVVMNVSGRGTNFEELTGKIDAKLYNLSLRGHHFNDVNAHLDLAPGRGGTNKVDLSSDIVDIQIERRYKLSDLIHIIPQRLGALAKAISLRDFLADSVHDEYHPILCRDSIDFDYFIHFKDLRPLAVFMPKTLLLANGSIQGVVTGCPNSGINIEATGDSIAFLMRARRFTNDTANVFPDSTTTFIDSSKRVPVTSASSTVPRIHLTPTTFTLKLYNLTSDPKTLLHHLNANFQLQTDSVARFNNLLFYHPKIALDYSRPGPKNSFDHHPGLNYDVFTVLNDKYAFRTRGRAEFGHGQIETRLDTLVFAYLRDNGSQAPDEYKWSSIGTTHIIYGPSSGLISIDTLTLVQPIQGYDPNMTFAQKLSLGGTLHGDTIDHVWLRAPSFNLEDIPRLLPLKSGSRTLKLSQFGGSVKRLNVDITGTMQRPDIRADLLVNGFSYGEMKFDSSYARFEYKDLAIRGSLGLHVDSSSFTDKSGTNALLINNNSLIARVDSIPMLIAFKHGPTYSQDSAAVSKRPMSAFLKTTHFPIDIAGPFIPIFKPNELHGLGDIDFKLGGTMENIQYTGQATVTDGSFVLASTNLTYLFDGPISFRDNRLEFKNHIRNVPADDQNGYADISGHLDFKGFSIRKLEVDVNTDNLMVLNTRSHSTVGVVYGPLVISTRGETLRLYNTLEEPILSGKIGIVTSYLTIPQSGSTTQSLSSEGIVYRMMLDDSALAARSSVNISKIQNSKVLALSADAGSVRMSEIDDTLFSNTMKDIYLNDDGSLRDSSFTGASVISGSSALNRSFMDRLEYNLQIAILGDVWIVMTFNRLYGLLGEQLTAQLKSDGIIYFNRGPDKVYNVTGDIELTPNSSYRFYQNFQIATGRISFRNDFANPQLDVVAEYIAPWARFPDQYVKLQLVISGTLKAPVLTAHIFIKGNSGVFEPRATAGTNPEEDAIYFLASGGYFKEDQDPQSQLAVIDRAGSALGAQVASSILNGLLGSTEILNIVRSASLSFGSNMGVRLNAVYKQISLRYSGNSISSGGFQSDYILTIPGYALTPKIPETRNLIYEFDAHTGSFNSNTFIYQPNFLAKILYRIPLP